MQNKQRMETNIAETLQQVARDLGIHDELADPDRRPYWIFDYVNDLKFEIEYVRREKKWGFIIAYNNFEAAEVLKEEFDWIRRDTAAKARFETVDELREAAQTIKNFIIDRKSVV